MKLEAYKKYYLYNELKVVPLLKEAGLMEEAAKVASCGAFFKGYKCKHCNVIHYQGFTRCKSKYCALCNYTKYLICFRRLYDFFRNWINSGHYCCLMTLTIKDGPYLSERLNVLNSAWRTMITTESVMATRFKKRFAGGFKALEVKLGKNSKEWHPHLHILTLKYEPSRDIEVIKQYWGQSLGRFEKEDYIPQVDIRAIKYRPGYNYLAGQRDPLVGACLEVLKYAVKMGDFSDCPERLPELYETMKGRRSYDFFGNLRFLQKEIAAEVTAFKHEDLLEEVKKTCKVCGCTELELESFYHDIIYDKPIIDGVNIEVEEGSREARIIEHYRREQAAKAAEALTLSEVDKQLEFELIDKKNSSE